MAHELTIDKEFATLIPPPTPDEIAQLRANLEADGCRDPIIVWANHDDTILDGHTRYEQCTELGIDFKIKAIRLESRDAALVWIAANQLGRRNLTPEQKSYLRGKEYLATAAQHGGDRRSAEASGKNCHMKTEAVLAEKHDVAPRTIRNDAEFAVAIDALDAAIGAKQAILSGASPLPKKDVAKAAAMKTKAAKKKAVETGKLPTPKAESPKVVDAKKRPVPADLLPAFEAVPEFRAIVREITAIKKRVEALADSPAGAFLDHHSAKTDLENARLAVKFGTPYTICHYCKGKGDGCKPCRGSGYLNQTPTSRNQQDDEQGAA